MIPFYDLIEPTADRWPFDSPQKKLFKLDTKRSFSLSSFIEPQHHFYKWSLALCTYDIFLMAVMQLKFYVCPSEISIMNWRNAFLHPLACAAHYEWPKWDGLCLTAFSTSIFFFSKNVCEIWKKKFYDLRSDWFYDSISAEKVREPELVALYRHGPLSCCLPWSKSAGIVNHTQFFARESKLVISIKMSIEFLESYFPKRRRISLAQPKRMNG